MSDGKVGFSGFPYWAIIFTLLSEDSGLPSEWIRRVEEIEGMCVIGLLLKTELR